MLLFICRLRLLSSSTWHTTWSSNARQCFVFFSWIRARVHIHTAAMPITRHTHTHIINNVHKCMLIEYDWNQTNETRAMNERKQNKNTRIEKEKRNFYLFAFEFWKRFVVDWVLVSERGEDFRWHQSQPFDWTNLNQKFCIYPRAHRTHTTANHSLTFQNLKNVLLLLLLLPVVVVLSCFFLFRVLFSRIIFHCLYYCLCARTSFSSHSVAVYCVLWSVV